MKPHYPAYARLCKGLNIMLFLMALLLARLAHAGALQDRQQELEPLFDAPCARYQVPKVLALAIARQESGCHPWIINISGRDVRYGWPVEQVLEPANNIKIGVWILAQEIRRHGLNWKAVAYYHTPLHKNPERGRAYARSVVGHVKKILDGK